MLAVPGRRSPELAGNLAPAQFVDLPALTLGWPPRTGIALRHRRRGRGANGGGRRVIKKSGRGFVGAHAL